MDDITFHTDAAIADGLKFMTPPVQMPGVAGAVAQHMQAIRSKLKAYEKLDTSCAARISQTSLQEALESCISNQMAVNAVCQTFTDIESFKYFMHEHKTCVVRLNGVPQRNNARLDRHVEAGQGDGWYAVCLYDQTHVVFQDPANAEAGAHSFERMEWPEFESAFVEGGCLDIDDRTIAE